MATIKPHALVRRFDVFAEYSRLKGLQDEGLSGPQAKGYGLWLAKVVAAQKFGRLERPTGEKKKGERKKTKWHELSGVAQTGLWSFFAYGSEFLFRVFPKIFSCPSPEYFWIQDPGS